MDNVVFLYAVNTNECSLTIVYSEKSLLILIFCGVGFQYCLFLRMWLKGALDKYKIYILYL